eukprot:3612697-Pyramimonas_sp.AAC.1
MPLVLFTYSRVLRLTGVYTWTVLRSGDRAPGGEGLTVLDGAHTPVAARMLAATLNEVFAGKTVALVVAMADDKQHEGVMRGLADVNACEALVLTQ